MEGDVTGGVVKVLRREMMEGKRRMKVDVFLSGICVSVQLAKDRQEKWNDSEEVWKGREG